LIYTAFNQYLKFGVISTTKTKNEKEITYPGITVCEKKTDFNPNPDRITKLTAINCLEINQEILRNCNHTEVTLYDHLKKEKVNCIQVNLVKNKDRLLKANKIGPSTSILLTIDIPLYKNIFFAITNNSAQVAFEEVNEIFREGHETYVEVKKTEQTALGPPYSQCNDSEGYQQMICTENCFKKNITESCGCEYPQGCLNETRFYDQNNICQRNHLASDSVLFDCKVKCPVECKKVTFSYNRIEVELPKPQGFVFRLATLRVFFNKLETTEITQSESISITSLIANVGGLLGEYIFL